MPDISEISLRSLLNGFRYTESLKLAAFWTRLSLLLSSQKSLSVPGQRRESRPGNSLSDKQLKEDEKVQA